MIKISRYAVEKFLNCKRCFFLEQKHKVRLQAPFTLNNAVDNLCKNEFDFYRRKQQPHPIFIKNNIDAVPFILLVWMIGEIIEKVLIIPIQLTNLIFMAQ